MNPLLKLWAAALLLVGCQAVTPAPLPTQNPLPVQQGTLAVSLRWPQRSVQIIPFSSQTIRLRILKGAVVLQELKLSRPLDDGGPLVSTADLQFSADSGLTVIAEAFRAASIAPGDLPLAAASASGVTVIANQKTPVQLSLVPAFVPTVTDFTPKNGGPGTPVTLTGSFGDSGFYGLRLAGRTNYGSLVGDAIVAAIPDGATTSTLVALADGVPSASGGTFRVLTTLELAPQATTTAIGGNIPFTATATADAEPVTSPTITRWEVIDPTKLDLPPQMAGSNVGTITATGSFTALANGTAWIRAWSGALSATAAVTVQ